MRFLTPLLLCIALSACDDSVVSALQPVDITRDTVCSLDGMTLADYPGPKAQIHYAQGEPEFFCDIIEMFATYLRPEQQRPVRALFVQDMSKADWNSPAGHWIDATRAFFVHGSDKRGSMGPTMATFAAEADARAFADKHGGQVLRFEQVKPELVSLDGGALHDQNM